MTTEQKYIDHVEKCFDKAYRCESKLTQEIHDIPGMTGRMTRHFYNNLLSIDDARYLEIGCWQGSSSCSAMYGNKASLVLIDDFSSFGAPREMFFKNYEKYEGENDATFIEADCFRIKPEALKVKFNIYLFDGDHSEQSQFMAIDHYLPAMDDTFIFVVDDYNWLSVRQGTYRAIEKNKLKIVWNKEVLLTENNEFTPDGEDKNNWWNGCAVFVLKKNSDEIESKYREFCNTPSDINEHLPTLRKFYDECDHVTELGVRGCVSLYAALASKAKKVVAVDIGNVWTPEVDKLQFICADDLQIEIEPTDALLIDTAHNYKQCIQELKLHAKKVRKYIFFHDTFMFGKDGDDGGKGLLFAIEEFLFNNPEWEQFYHTNANNGLTGIKRK